MKQYTVYITIGNHFSAGSIQYIMADSLEDAEKKFFGSHEKHYGWRYNFRETKDSYGGYETPMFT